MRVLILVWVEYGLGVYVDFTLVQIHLSLNPCLGGIWSWSTAGDSGAATAGNVLILVWVEYGLGVP